MASLRGIVEGLLLRDTISQLQRGYAEVIVALVGAVEAKDVYTRGHSIIKDVRSLQAVVGGVRHHHERLDGSGYPDGLVGEQIPLEARIIAVADVFDALTSLRPYRPAWSRDRALAVLDEQAGTKLDAACVHALHTVLERRRAPQMLGMPAAAAIAD